MPLLYPPSSGVMEVLAVVYTYDRCSSWSHGFAFCGRHGQPSDVKLLKFEVDVEATHTLTDSDRPEEVALLAATSLQRNAR